MKRGFCLAGIILLIFIISAFHVNASSAAGISPSKIDIPFFPYAEQRIDFRVTGYSAIDFEFKCPYVHPINETLADADGAGFFSVIVKLPEKIDADPGDYNCGFTLHRPKNPNMPAGVGASAEVGVVLYVHIPEKGRYAAMSIEAQNANKGEPVFFHVSVRNLGEEDLYGLTAKIEVQDINNKTIETLFTETGDALRFESAELWKRMETTNYEPAKYKAKASLYYAGPKEAEAETEFLIGKLFVNFLGIEANATAEKINPVTVNLESWWGNPIENVKAVVSMTNASGYSAGEFETVSTDLGAWQKAPLKGYWDAAGLMPGEYNADISLKYKGGETKAQAKLKLQAGTEEKAVDLSFEKIKDIIASPIFVVLLVLILMINIGMWMMKQRKEKKKEKK